MQKKIYTEKGEKVVDFLIGFFVIPFGINISLVLLSWGISFLFKLKTYAGAYWITILAVGALELSLAIYLAIKRKYMGIGLLFALVVVPLVLLGTCLLIFAGGSLLRIF